MSLAPALLLLAPVLDPALSNCFFLRFKCSAESSARSYSHSGAQTYFHPALLMPRSFLFMFSGSIRYAQSRVYSCIHVPTFDPKLLIPRSFLLSSLHPTLFLGLEHNVRSRAGSYAQSYYPSCTLVPALISNPVPGFDLTLSIPRLFLLWFLLFYSFLLIPARLSFSFHRSFVALSPPLTPVFTLFPVLAHILSFHLL